MHRDPRDDSPRNVRTSRVPVVAATGMREELRAANVKCFVLALAKAKGEGGKVFARDVVENAGVDPALLDQETSWISVDAARRVVLAIVAELPDLAGDIWMLAAEQVGHPDNLGPWVRLIRESKTPLEAYRYFAKNGQEHTRVGEWSLEGEAEAEAPDPNEDRESLPAPEADLADKPSIRHTAGHVVLVYRPRPDEPPEADDILERVRATSLAGLTTLWGLGPARVVTHECMSKGAEFCRYEVTWTVSAENKLRAPLFGAGACAVAVAAVSPFGGWVAGAIAGLVSGGLGIGVAQLLARQQRLERDQAFERTRIAALERGLSLRGDGTSTMPRGELEAAVLGGKYRIGKRIGSGGIGVVHAAEHIALGTQVAVKVLRGAAAKDGAEIARLRREAQVSSALDHPNVVKVLDLDQLQDGSIYVVMELLRGKSLAEKLHKDGPLGPGFAVHVFRQVCHALGAAHDIGVVHRDLKPGNVFLCDDGETAKVLDFGMSKLGAGMGMGNEKLTQDGYTLGTPEYMAPEQCIGASVEPRTDLYELGVLMYEALTGDLPIKSHNRRELLDLHQRQVPPLMRQRRPDLPIPRELDEAVAMCLRKRIHERPASARVFEQMLADVPLDDVPIHYTRNVGRAPPAGRRKERPDDQRPTEKAKP